MTKTLNEIKIEVQAMDGVYSASVWADRRVYVNFVGFDRSFAGCRNLKVYYDIKTGWQIDGIKGNYTSEFASNVRHFCRAIGGNLLTRDGACWL